MIVKTETKPSGFIVRLNNILNNKSYDDIIRIDRSNGKIFIFDKEKLENEILSVYYRHHKLTSFIRQLNLYGFKKVKTPSALCYCHPLLIQGENMLSILSKKPSKKAKEAESSSQQEQNNENRQIEEKQKSEEMVNRGTSIDKAVSQLQVTAQTNTQIPISRVPIAINKSVPAFSMMNGWWNIPQACYPPMANMCYPFFNGFFCG